MPSGHRRKGNAVAGVVAVDERTTWFYEAVISSDGMVNPRVGAGWVYMTTKRDSIGTPVRADRTYRLRVPKDVPVGQFWAADTRRRLDERHRHAITSTATFDQGADRDVHR